MTYVYNPRETWQTATQPVTGPPFNWDTIELIIIHYNGGKLVWPYNTAQVLRNQQSMYLNKPKPYSLGYNDAVDWPGEAWEIRGEDIKSAATQEVNAISYAIQILVNSVTAESADAANPNQIEAVRNRVAAVRKRAGWKVPIAGHFQYATNTTHTPCPGLAIRRQILDGVFEPVDAPVVIDPLPIDDEEFLMAAIQAIYKPGPGVTRPNPKWFVLRADGGIRHASGPDVEHGATLNVPTYTIGGDEHYDQLDTASQK